MKKHLFTLFLLLSITKIQSQPIINTYYKGFADISKSTLYVVMNPDIDANQEYEEVFNKYWKLCPVEIINYNDILQHLTSNSLFMTPYITYVKNHNVYQIKSRTFQNFQLIIWKPTTRFIDKLSENPKKIKDFNFFFDASSLADINLKADDSKKFNVINALSNDFMGKEFMITYGQGFLKNYLQNLQTSITNEIINPSVRKNAGFNPRLIEYYNSKELTKLRNVTLYIPDVLFNVYKNNGDLLTKKKNDVKKTYNVSEDYPYKYELISIDNLNDLIMNSDEPVYYLTKYLDFDSNGKTIITITNSETGEIIYYDYKLTFKMYSHKLIKRLTKRIELSNKQ